MHRPPPSSRSWFAACRLWPLACLGLLPAGLPAQESVAVFTRVFNGYVHARLPDKTLKPETYAFGEGGCLTRPVKDAAMEEMTFAKVAQAVAVPLARQNYLPTRSSAETDLLILVFWGATEGSHGHDPSNTVDRFSSAASVLAATKDNDPLAADPATAAAQGARDDALWQLDLQNRDRDGLDDRNARILGYTESLDRARSASHMSFAQDIMVELGENRYYVVLQAYDFKTAHQEKKLKPLWTARISMSESGKFAQSLDLMLRSAGRYLGQDSNGLHRGVNREGHVNLAPLEILGTAPAK